ncbi:MAG: carboxylesterase/lipase family protein [Pseudomonadales bacterium]
MKKLLIIIAIAVLAAVVWHVMQPEEPVAAPKVADEGTKRNVTNGEIIGYRENSDVAAWLGIPYAENPSGNLRWRAPRPPQPFVETFAALNPGPYCAQNASMLVGASDDELGKPAGSEGCLTLNIWSPVDAEPGSLPVMFWIHGGGNSIGTGGSDNYNGTNLASRHDVVVVTINYRLGPFGWFSHPALHTGDAADDSGNFGTLDIIAALSWVQSNITAFGGDPDNVTIFGESAGGVNVLTMMASPLAEGLYHKAIVQSGGLFVSPLAQAQNYHDDANAPGHKNSSREIVNKLLVKTGLAADSEDARQRQNDMSETEIKELLYNQSAAGILALYNDGESVGGMLDMPAVLGDGYVLPKSITTVDLFSDHENYNVTPVMLGTNRDEVRLFMMLSGEPMDTLFGIPYRLKDKQAYVRDSGYGSDYWKATGVDEIAMNLSKAQTEGVYAYRFDWDEQAPVFGFDLSTALGAAHGLEIGFVFGNFTTSFFGAPAEEDLPARDALSDAMMSYWAEFAYNGNPGQGRAGDLPTWTTWQNTPADANRLLVLDSQNDAGIRMEPTLITRDLVKQRFLADTSYPDQASYCAAYQQIFRMDGFDEAEYATLGEGGCQP